MKEERKPTETELYMKYAREGYDEFSLVYGLVAATVITAVTGLGIAKMVYDSNNTLENKAGVAIEAPQDPDSH